MMTQYSFWGEKILFYTHIGRTLICDYGKWLDPLSLHFLICKMKDWIPVSGRMKN